ncbi:hypothetical protein C0J52_05580 [Blattella germanica]|nr:hypothetical protein C0J52_05580 [Blattella germanica]
MPKLSVPLRSKLQNYVNTYGSDVFSTDGVVLVCKICEQSVNYEKKYFISQHINTTKHKNALSKVVSKNKISLLPTVFASSSRQSQFSFDLCKAFLASGIPLWKIENPTLREFLEKYTKESVPCESSLRKSYLTQCYDTVLDMIKEKTRNKKVWISIDESADATGRFIANVIVGVLDHSSDESVKPFLLTSECLDRVNSTTIAQLFTTSLKLMWPEEVQHDNVLLFISDAATYMKKAAKALKVLFPKMLHVTCVAHGFHRVSEEVRVLFPNVDQLISNIKKIFLKAPSRIQTFRDIAPDLPLPPQPIITRWGTWISAAVYYASNFRSITEVVNALEDEAASIRAAKKLLDSPEVKNDITFIAAHFGFLPEMITRLEERGQPLLASMKIVESVVQRLESVPGEKGLLIKGKCERVLSQNSDLDTLRNISKILNGDNSVQVEMDPSVLLCFRFAPITSVDVERSFSQMKNVLNDRRHNMTVENLKKHLVVMCNQ